MAKGASKLGGGNNGGRGMSEAVQNMKGINGYKVTTATGDEVEMFFTKNGDTNYYKNSLTDTFEETPNNWTEKQMIDRINENGGNAQKYSKQELEDKEQTRIEQRRQSDKLLDAAYLQDETMKRGSRANRIRNRNRKRGR